jgi:hypothetical protein
MYVYMYLHWNTNTIVMKGILMTYIKPNDVHSPKSHWHLFEVMIDKGIGRPAYALGTWDGERRMAFRWNGNEDNPIGNPQSRGLPTWVMLDEDFHSQFVEILPADKKLIAKAFLGLK